MNEKKCIRALLCLYLTLIFTMDVIKAQALKVGDTLAPELWSLPLRVINHPQGKETITLSEYKGKLIILDFWATWCAPCVAMLSTQDSMQQVFKDQIQILPVTYQNAEEVSSFMEKYEKRKDRENNLPKVVGDNVLRAAFPHTYLPHYVWLDASGTVKAITGYEEIKAEKIAAILSGSVSSLITKVDPVRIPYDQEVPLLINGNGGRGDRLIYHSILTGYQAGMPSKYSISEIDSLKGIKLTCVNLSRLTLFKSAFGERTWTISKNQIIMEVGDPARLSSPLTGNTYLEWLNEGNGFCYELILPSSQADQVFSIMRQDMDLLFPEYRASVEKRRTKCFVLTRVKQDFSFETKGGDPMVIHEQFRYKSINRPLGLLVRNLSIKFLQNSPFPILNETGIDELVDIDIEADMSDVNDLNRALAKYELKFIESEREIDMLVIRDR